VPFIGYAFGTTVWQLMAFAVVFGAGETAGMVVCVTLYLVAGLRRDEDEHPLLGEDYAGVGASSADSGSGTPAIS
jgi:hypothetical protein